MCSIVEDENERAALLRSRGGQMHRRTAGDNHRRAACAADECSVGRLKTGFSRERMPGFGSGMLMRGRCHARIESRLHVLHGVSATRDDWEQ